MGCYLSKLGVTGQTLLIYSVLYNSETVRRVHYFSAAHGHTGARLAAV